MKLIVKFFFSRQFIVGVVLGLNKYIFPGIFFHPRLESCIQVNTVCVCVCVCVRVRVHACSLYSIFLLFSGCWLQV